LAGARGQEKADDREPGARVSPRAPSTGGGCARTRPDSLPEGACVYLMGIAPEPLGDPSGVGRGVSRLETFDPEG
jgi:hypothetical protein